MSTAKYLFFVGSLCVFYPTCQSDKCSAHVYLFSNDFHALPERSARLRLHWSQKVKQIRITNYCSRASDFLTFWQNGISNRRTDRAEGCDVWLDCGRDTMEGIWNLFPEKNSHNNIFPRIFWLISNQPSELWPKCAGRCFFQSLEISVSMIDNDLQQLLRPEWNVT